MKRQLMICAVIAVAAFLIVAGCTTTKSGSGQDSRLVLKSSYEKFTLQLDANNQIHVNVTTDSPVNVLLLDAAGISNYTSAMNDSGASWTALASRLNTSAADFNYPAGTGGTYYIVVDNTGKVSGGAAGNQDVFVRASWSYS
jgi:predicted small secreted protein